MKQSYGVITEQGDLGLGFHVLNESEANAIKKNAETAKKKYVKKDKDKKK